MNHHNLSLSQKFLILPLALAKVFTWDKSFRQNPLIGSALLNRLGLHVMRIIASHCLFAFRLLLLAPLASRSLRQQFWRDGYVKIENFLPPEQFERLKNEALALRGEVREEIEGTTLTQRVYLTEETLSELPECASFCNEPQLLKLMRYASSKNRIPFFHLENIIHDSEVAKRKDPQKDLHSDTFHPCVKAWLYLDATSDRNGPFIFVPGSHRLTWKRLVWDYRQSVIASKQRSEQPKERYWDGSFRFSEADLQELGYPQPVAMKVPENTLLIANVRGTHRRGDAVPGATRMTVWMQSRDNPFNPLFSPFPHLTARLFEFIWRRHMRAKTLKQIRQGNWRVKTGGFTTDRQIPPHSS